MSSKADKKAKINGLAERLADVARKMQSEIGMMLVDTENDEEYLATCLPGHISVVKQDANKINELAIDIQEEWNKPAETRPLTAQEQLDRIYEIVGYDGYIDEGTVYDIGDEKVEV